MVNGVDLLGNDPYCFCFYFISIVYLKYGEVEKITIDIRLFLCVLKLTKVLLFVSLSIGLDCEIDISKSIQNVRAQRSGMVQTEVDATVA